MKIIDRIEEWPGQCSESIPLTAPASVAGAGGAVTGDVPAGTPAVGVANVPVVGMSVQPRGLQSCQS